MFCPNQQPWPVDSPARITCDNGGNNEHCWEKTTRKMKTQGHILMPLFPLPPVTVIARYKSRDEALVSGGSISLIRVAQVTFGEVKTYGDLRWHHRKRSHLGVVGREVALSLFSLYSPLLWFLVMCNQENVVCTITGTSTGVLVIYRLKGCKRNRADEVRWNETESIATGVVF